MKRFGLGLALAWLLCACASAPQLREGRLQPPTGLAYAVVSVTLDALNPPYADAGICLKGPQGNFCLEAQSNVDFVRAPGDEPDAIGRLHVVALSAGSYRIVNIHGGISDDVFGPGTLFYQRTFFDLNDRFTLSAGEAVYLGNYHISLNNLPSFRREDARRRDFNDLRERWGVTDTSNIMPKLAFTK